MAAARSRAARPQPCDGQRAGREWPGCAADLAFGAGRQKRAEAGRSLRSNRAPRLLCRLAERILGDAGREGRVRKAARLDEGLSIAESHRESDCHHTWIDRTCNGATAYPDFL